MAKRRKRRKKRAKLAGARTTGTVGAAGLLKQLAAHRGTLLAQQAEIEHEIDSIGMAIEALGGKAAARSAPRRGRKPKAKAKRKRGGKRGVREGSLKSYILRVLRGSGQMTVKNIATAVKHAGYTTSSANFPNQVSNALAKMGGVTKVRRGCYKA